MLSEDRNQPDRYFKGEAWRSRATGRGLSTDPPAFSPTAPTAPKKSTSSARSRSTHMTCLKTALPDVMRKVRTVDYAPLSDEQIAAARKRRSKER